MGERGWGGALRFGLPGVVLGLVLAWVAGGGRGPMAWAQTASAGERGRMPVATPAGEAGGMLAFTAPFGPNGSAQLLYLVDTRARSFAVYRIDPSNSNGTVKLEAARQYGWDLKLTAYNNAAPEVEAIESMVKALGPPSR